MQDQIRVGVGALIIRERKILLGQRLNAHGSGFWGPPGGHLDWFETPEACAIRETHEETGLTLLNPQRGPWSNDIFDGDNKHYVSLFILGTTQGEPECREPEKCLGWEWFSLENLPSPLFLPLQNLVQSNAWHSLFMNNV